MTDPLSDEVAKARALLESVGAEVRVPHRTTQQRRAQRTSRNIAVISRSGRSYRQDDGRVYGEVDIANQRQADAGAWRANAAIRADCLPLVVGVAGETKRIWEVLSWHPDGKKWTAELGRLLTDEELDEEYPDLPYRYGSPCPTRRGGAYRPETY